MARIRLRPIIACLWCIGLFITSPATFAQEATISDISCTLGAPTGARRYRPGEWGVVEFRAANPTGELAEIQAVLQFIDDPTIQFSRRVVVPPRSVLRSTCPVRVPDNIAPGRKSIEFLTERVVPPRKYDPARVETPQEVLAQAQPMILNYEDPTVGRIADQWEDRPQAYEHAYHGLYPPLRPETDYPIYNLIIAAMRSRKLSRRVGSFDTVNLPADVASLDALDVLVLSSDRLASDPGGIALLRNWVLRGGYLWITLHDVEERTVSAVLGDAFTSTVVDRIELNSVSISGAQPDLEGQQTETIELEEPVRLARVVVEDGITTHEVDGWPAAFWQPFGDGRVYFTTVGPAAWMRPTLPSDPPPVDILDETPFFPRRTLDALAADILSERPAERLDADYLKPFVSQEIGYRIPGRGTITAILGVFCLALAGAGVYLFLAGRAERMLWLTPLAAVMFGAAFLTIGSVTKRAVPATAATIARISLESGVGGGHSAGLVALYNQDANRERIGAESGGMFFPDMTAMSGRKRRITWTDEDTWYWEDLELPAGVRTAPFERPIALDSAVLCQAAFGPDGLQGQLTAPLRGLEDVIISIPHQNAISVSIDESGTFRSGPDDLLARGEYLASSLLSDNQVRRKAIYDHLVGARLELDASPRPILFAWCDPQELGFVFPQSTRRNATVFSIPVRLEPTEPGTQVRIPSPFIGYRATRGPEGFPSVAYANLTHQWIECSIAVTQWLRFQMPATVLPLELSEARVLIDVRAPSRTVEILAPGPDEPVVLLRLYHPIGSYGCTIDQPALLSLDDSGGLLLAVRVSVDESADPEDAMTQAPWLIEQLQVDVTGKVQGE